MKKPGSEGISIFTARKTKFAKVMFLHLSVSHSVHGGGSASLHAGIADSPGSRHPPAQYMLGDTANKRAVRILLECILVAQCEQ